MTRATLRRLANTEAMTAERVNLLEGIRQTTRDERLLSKPDRGMWAWALIGTVLVVGLLALNGEAVREWAAWIWEVGP